MKSELREIINSDLFRMGGNTSIAGKVNIGSNVMIAPGSFINFDVPSNSIVFGNPGIIKESLTATNGYIGWPV